MKTFGPGYWESNLSSLDLKQKLNKWAEVRQGQNMV
jgi:hypothetical protein